MLKIDYLIDLFAQQMNAFENLVHRSSNKPWQQHLDTYADDMHALAKGTAVIWSSGLTFRNACDISVLYVTGILVSSPYHKGPILSESSPISKQLAKCTRNGLLTVCSEPVQKDVSLLGEEYTVDNASVEFWIKKHNVTLLLKELEKYEDRFDIVNLSKENKEQKFSYDFGESYFIENEHTTHFFITDTEVGSNEMYQMLADISKRFTDLPRGD